MFKCKSCGKEKDESAFSKHHQCVGGYDTSRCKSCKKSAFDWSRVPLEKKIYNRTKARAKIRGITFDLKLEDIVIPDKCPVFGKPFIYGDPDWTASIDRINPKLGYIKGNILIISNKANRIKSDADLEDFRMVLEYMEWASKEACEIKI